jgi:hypothetical protein
MRKWTPYRNTSSDCPPSSEPTSKDVFLNGTPRPELEENTYLFVLPRWAMAAAKTLWPGEARHAVWLAPEAAANWLQHYFAQIGPEAPYWFIRNWWEIDAPAPDGTDLTDFPELLEPWLCRSGVIWGSMAGGQFCGAS